MRAKAEYCECVLSAYCIAVSQFDIYSDEICTFTNFKVPSGLKSLALSTSVAEMPVGINVV